MNTVRKLLLASLVVPVLVGFTIARQGQQDEETAYWHVSYFTVDWRLVDSLQTLMKTYSLPRAEEAKKTGRLLDYKVLIHYAGDERNVVVMAKYRSWDDIDDNILRDARRRLEPDSLKRREIDRAFREILQGMAHRDVIYTELTAEM